MADQPEITPPVGSVMLYWPSDDVIHYARIDGVKGRPLAALVAWVNDDSDRTLNLGVFDRYGRPHDQQRVLLVQPGEKPPERTKTNAYCTWPVTQHQTIAGAEPSA